MHNCVGIKFVYFSNGFSKMKLRMASTKCHEENTMCRLQPNRPEDNIMCVIIFVSRAICV